MFTRLFIRGFNLIASLLGREVTHLESTTSNTQNQTALQATTTPSATNSHDHSPVQVDITYDNTLDQRFYLAVSIGTTAVLLPIFSSLLQPIARDCLTFLDAATWLLSIIFAISQDYYNSRSRLFCNAILAALAFGILGSGFRAAISDIYALLPLAVNVAIVINAQEIPWTCTRRQRSQEDILPIHNHGNGAR